MRATRSSTTAEQMALSRAIETRKPAAERICCDPLAERFLRTKYRMLLCGRPLRDAVEGLIERRFAGHHCYVIARTRYFDDLLEQRLAGGAEQLVILGAGYDSRPYRFADRLGGVQVFEVDYPATSTAKQAKVRALIGEIPANVAYVPVDFTVDNLADKLLGCGYRTTRPTVFLGRRDALPRPGGGGSRSGLCDGQCGGQRDRVRLHTALGGGGYVHAAWSGERIR